MLVDQWTRASLYAFSLHMDHYASGGKCQRDTITAAVRVLWYTVPQGTTGGSIGTACCAIL